MRILLSIFSFIISNALIAQFSYFNTTYNPNNTWSIGNSIIEYNGSYYLTGGTSDSIAGYQSIFIANIDAEGGINFWKTYGGYPYAYWPGYTNALISTTSIGELVLAGARSSSGSSATGTYYNFQTNGDTNCTVQYPDTNYTGFTIFHQCKQTSDGGFIFVGKMTVEQYNSDILLIKTDHAGNEEWRQHYGKPITWAVDYGYNVLETADSGYLIGYYFYIAGQEETGNPYMLKVDKSGNYEWEVNLGGPYEDLLAVSCHSSDGNYMCAASITDSVAGDYLFTRVHITKISTDGSIIWSKIIGDFELFNKVYGIYQDHENGYVLCGVRYEAFENPSYFDHSRGWICKIDEDGDSIWWREYKHFTGPEWHMNRLRDMHLTSDGGYIAVGRAETLWETETWVIKVDSFGCDTPDCQTVRVEELSNSQDEELYIYPNPASSEIQIVIRYSISDTRYSILIYDLLGRKQEELIVPEGQTHYKVDVSTYPTGIYIAVLKNERYILEKGKFVVR
ncbi:MAG: T9SS type A sorting domain-containing protein [Bacteroidota bacterium]